jgi:hypothetical protein
MFSQNVIRIQKIQKIISQQHSFVTLLNQYLIIQFLLFSIYTQMPNVLGFMFGVAQIGIYLYYKRCLPIVRPETPVPITPTPTTAKDALDLSGMIQLPENLHIAIVSMSPVPVVEVRRLDLEPDLGHAPLPVPVKTV